MLKKLIIPVVLVSMLGAAAYYYVSRTEPGVSQGPQPTGLAMKVARYYWPGEYWIEIADKKGWFKDAGLNIELVDTNPDYYQSLQDMAAGKLDVNNFALFDLMNFRVQGNDLVMVLNCDQSAGSEAIVAQPDIQRIRDLKGKTVGVSAGSYTDYILDIALKNNGLLPSDIVKVDILEEQVLKDFAERKLDAVVIWEPVVSQVIKEANGRKLFDTVEVPGISPNGQVFHRDFIQERPGDVHAYARVWHRTTEFIKQNPKEAFGIIAAIYKVTPGEVQAFAQKDKILDLQDNLRVFSYSAGFESLHGSARKMNDFMIGHGLTKQRLDSTEFLDARFIRGLERQGS